MSLTAQDKSMPTGDARRRVSSPEGGGRLDQKHDVLRLIAYAIMYGAGHNRRDASQDFLLLNMDAGDSFATFSLRQNAVLVREFQNPHVIVPIDRYVSNKLCTNGFSA